MIKNRLKIYAAFCLLMTISLTANAQQYEWVKGGGSSRDFSSLASWRWEQVRYMCTDDNRNIYILAKVGDLDILADTFYISQAVNYASVIHEHILFCSYDCNGNMRFAKLIESQSDNQPYGLVYSSGKVYLAGTLFNANKRIGYDASLSSIYQSNFLAKFDTSGLYHWIEFIGPDNNATYVSTRGPSSVAVDGMGNIHHINYMGNGVQLNSTTISSTGTYDLKYDVNGNLLTAIRLQGIDTNYVIENGQIDPSTNIFYGVFKKSPTPPLANADFCVMAFGPTGVRLWSTCTGPHGGLSSLRVRSGDGIYVVGGASNNNPFLLGGMSAVNTSYYLHPIAVVTKLDFNGNAKWMRKTEGSTGVHSLLDLEILPNNDIVAGGVFVQKSKYGTDSITSTAGEYWNALIYIIDSAGKLIKQDQLHGQNSEMITAITSDKVGNIYIGGQLETNISATGLTPYTTHGGNTDFFVMKYGRDCSCTSLPSAAFSFVVNAQNRSASFSFTGTSPADSIVWDFGDGSSSRQQNPMHVFPQHGNYTVCATVYTPCGSNKTCQAVSIPVSVQDVAAFQNIRIYPNPTTAQLQIEGLSTHAAYEIYNTLGTALQKGQLNPGRNTISTQALPAGIYLLQVQSDGGEKQVYRINKQ